MKRIPLILILTVLFQVISAQNLPKEFEQRLSRYKSEAEEKLKTFRTSREGDLRYDLSFCFLDNEKHLLDSLGIKLNIGMVYDQSMRERITQLLRNEFADEELDGMIDRSLQFSNDQFWRTAMDSCRFDTLTLYKQVYDSIVPIWKVTEPEKWFGEFKYRVCKYMELDTTGCFKYKYEIISNEYRKLFIDELKNESLFNLDEIAMLAGYIGDTAFIEPLIAALDNDRNFTRERVLKALVRMKVEPYYTDYFNAIPQEQHEIGALRWFEIYRKIDDLANLIRTQESFLKLSKYLLCTIAVDYIHIGLESYEGKSAQELAAEYISRDILNEEVQKELCPWQSIIGGSVDYEKLYEWMQANYGNYQIRRIW
ncbi:MAG: hypothetical protein GXX78_16915 [Bacteroidales bacterium]|nr:hypothetical protein [Bacteroidales bacterium]